MIIKFLILYTVENMRAQRARSLVRPLLNLKSYYVQYFYYYYYYEQRARQRQSEVAGDAAMYRNVVANRVQNPQG